MGSGWGFRFRVRVRVRVRVRIPRPPRAGTVNMLGQHLDDCDRLRLEDPQCAQYAGQGGADRQSPEDRVQGGARALRVANEPRTCEDSEGG